MLKKIGKKYSKIMLTGVLMLLLLRATPPSFAQNSSSASTDSVRLSTSEADSLLLMLDTYETQLRLGQIDLRECREIARLDSLAFLQYREATKVTWLDRILHEPIVWFMLGVYTGAQVIVHSQ